MRCKRAADLHGLGECTHILVCTVRFGENPPNGATFAALASHAFGAFTPSYQVAAVCVYHLSIRLSQAFDRAPTATLTRLLLVLLLVFLRLGRAVAGFAGLLLVHLGDGRVRGHHVLAGRHLLDGGRCSFDGRHGAVFWLGYRWSCFVGQVRSCCWTLLRCCGGLGWQYGIRRVDSTAQKVWIPNCESHSEKTTYTAAL